MFSSFEIEKYCKCFGIPKEKFDFIPWPFADRATDSLDREPKEFCCAVGGNSRDYLTLIEAAKKIPDIPIHIVCRPTKEMSEANLPSSVTVSYNLPRETTENLIKNSRFMILPLKDAPLATGHVTLVYALMYSKPIVSTDNKGIADYILPDKTGLLVPPRNPDALALAIKRLWADPDKTKKMGIEARQFYTTHCTETCLEEYLTAEIKKLTGA